jgi:uncharacterized protein (TIRG00374 family)
MREVWSVTMTARMDYILLIFCSVNLNTLVKALRWFTIIRSTGSRQKFRWVFAAYTIGQMFNWIFPARMGDISRVVLLGRQEVGEATAAGTLVLEKILDSVYFLFLIFLLPCFLPLPDWLTRPAELTVVISVVAVIAFVLLLFMGRHGVEKWDEKAQQFPEYPRRWVMWFLRQLSLGIRSLEALWRRREFILVNMLTIIVWLTAIANVWWSFHALSLPFNQDASKLGAALLVLISLQLGIAVPSVPGRVGIFELVCMLALSVFAIPENLSLGSAILLHSLVMFPIILVGLVALIWMSAQRSTSVLQE